MKTIEVSDELYRRVEAEAALRGSNLKDLIEEGLRLVLDKQQKTKGETKNRPANAYEAMKSMCGIIDTGIPDLGSNKKHLEGLGLSRNERRDR